MWAPALRPQGPAEPGWGRGRRIKVAQALLPSASIWFEGVGWRTFVPIKRITDAAGPDTARYVDFFSPSKSLIAAAQQLRFLSS